MGLTVDEIRMRFRRRGLNFTGQRHAIYQALANSVAHPGVEEIYTQVRHSFPSLSMNTVYTTLVTLKDIGVISEVSPVRDRARFDANRDPHHHLVCLGCRKIEDLYDHGLDRISLSEEQARSFKITGHRVEFHGYCKRCRLKTPKTTKAPKPKRRK